MDKINTRYNKKLEEYNYQELDNLKWKIREMPNFIISEDSQNFWFNKITKLQDNILNQYEELSNASRYDKVKKYLEYKQELGHIYNQEVRYEYADRRPFGCSIDEFYLNYRYEIECLWSKIQRIAPLTKEQLEILVAKDIEKYDL